MNSVTPSSPAGISILLSEDELAARIECAGRAVATGSVHRRLDGCQHLDRGDALYNRSDESVGTAGSSSDGRCALAGKL